MPLRPVLLALGTAGLLLAGNASPGAMDDVLAPLTSAYMQAVKPGEQAELYRGLFQPILEAVQHSYPGDVDHAGFIAEALHKIEQMDPQSGDPADVFKKSINSALASLDPHSWYLDPRELSNERRTINAAIGDVGLELEVVDGVLRVLNPIPGTPAARAGLQRSDIIVRLDEEPAQGLALTEVVSRIRGEPGTSIALTIRRAGSRNDFTVSLVRETIRTQVVRWSVEDDVLVLRLASFMGEVSALMEQAITDAIDVRRPRGVVLDLRGNLGGVFRQGVKTADAFLS